jgi:hypothetical protein
MNDLLPKLENLSETFFAFPLHQQQLFISTVYSRSLSWDGQKYKTDFLDPLFADKALILKEKGLLEIEQSLSKNEELPSCTRDGS